MVEKAIEGILRYVHFVVVNFSALDMQTQEKAIVLITSGVIVIAIVLSEYMDIRAEYKRQTKKRTGRGLL